MKRRTLLKQLAALPLLPRRWAEWPLVPPALPRPVTNSRVRPSDPGWPNAASWDKLKQQVGGRLTPVQSPLAACQALSDSVSCQTLFKNLDNPFYIGDQPGLTQTLGWVGGWTTAPSTYAVAASSAEDVAAAVNFARDNRLRLVVKGGGHSYQGTSNAPDSLLIWTRPMNEISLYSAFVPKGCLGTQRPQQAVTLGAGVIWLHAYDAVTTKGGQYVQGGGCTTVGVAGLIQSGGFGSFSKHYGLAAGGLLQAEVVTADGKIRIANACTNPDLFWALKGGGGGSFGVVTKLTLRVRDLPEFFGGAIMTIKASSDAAYRSLIRQFVGFYHDALFNEHWGEQAHFNPDNSLQISMVSYDLSSDEAKKIWKPFMDWVAASPGSYTMEKSPIVGSMPAKGWWDPTWRDQHGHHVFITDSRPDAHPGDVWWTGDGGQVGQVLYAFDSQWLPASLLAGDSQQRLSDALFAASRHWEVELHFNKGLAGAPADAIAAARDTATNPAVLSAFTLAIIASGTQHAYPGVRGHEPDIVSAQREGAAVASAMADLRKVAPQPGAYLSESNFFDRTWQQSYWGANYQRLLAIKKQYDPDGLFFVHNGVGSEDWGADGFMRKGG